MNDYLHENNVNNIILCGMQTEHCLDATCKIAFEYGYNVSIPQSATTTFNNEFFSGKQLSDYYEKMIWHNRYAQVININDLLLEI